MTGITRRMLRGMSLATVLLLAACGTGRISSPSSAPPSFTNPSSSPPAVSSPSPLASAPAASLTDPKSRAAGVISAYFDNINSHNYGAAYALLGSALRGRQNAGDFAAGYAGIAHDTLQILSIDPAGPENWSLMVRLIAEQTDGSVKTYSGTYLVGPEGSAFKVLQAQIAEASASAAAPAGSSPAAADAGLIAFLDSAGIGVFDPHTGQSSMLARFANPAPSVPTKQFFVFGPVWGPSPTGGRPALYFSVHDSRGVVRGASAAAPPPTYDWLFRADPWGGTLAPLAARVDYTGSGPVGLAVAGKMLGFTFGCCTDFSAYSLPLGASPEAPVQLTHSGGLTFLEGGAPNGRFVVSSRQPGGPAKWSWLTAPAGTTNPFPIPPGATDGGAVTFSPDGAEAAIAVNAGGLGIWSTAQPSSSLHLINSLMGRPASASWSPEVRAVAVASQGSLTIVSPDAPNGAGQGQAGASPSLPPGIVPGGLPGQGVSNVSWSGPAGPDALAAIRPIRSFVPDLDQLLSGTKVPPGTTTAYVWQFDPAHSGNAAAAIGAESGVPSAQFLQQYPPLATLSGSALADGYAVPDGWLLGLPYCYRLDFVGPGSSAKGAATVSLGGSCQP